MTEWISISEEKPKINDSNESDDVLIIDSGGNQYVASLFFYPIEGYRKVESSGWSERTTGCGCCCRDINPTHWMPLPKPP